MRRSKCLQAANSCASRLALNEAALYLGIRAVVAKSFARIH
jgi:hypothetical protein